MSNKVLVLSTSEKAIAEVKNRYANVTEIRDTADYALAKAGIREFREMRVDLNKDRKSKGEEARKWIKKVNAKAAELTAYIRTEEDRLSVLKKAVDDKKAEKKAKQEAAEQRRLDTIRTRIYEIAQVGQVEYGTPKEDVEKRLIRLIDFEATDQDFQEFVLQAKETRKASIESLQRVLNDMVAKEEEDKKRAEEQAEIDAENERIKKEQEEAQARIDAENERIKKEQEEAQARIDAENKRLEKERLEREEAERREAKRVKREKEIEAAKPDIEKLLNYSQRIMVFAKNESPDVKGDFATEVLHDVEGQLGAVANVIFLHIKKFKGE